MYQTEKNEQVFNDDTEVITIRNGQYIVCKAKNLTKKEKNNIIHFDKDYGCDSKDIDIYRDPDFINIIN